MKRNRQRAVAWRIKPCCIRAECCCIFIFRVFPHYGANPPLKIDCEAFGRVLLFCGGAHLFLPPSRRVTVPLARTCKVTSRTTALLLVSEVGHCRSRGAPWQRQKSERAFPLVLMPYSD